MEDTGLHDGVDIDAILSALKIHQYANMAYNNKYHLPLINVKISP